MAKIDYPPKPEGSQYPGRFPHIDASGGPAESGENQVEQVYLTIQPVVENGPQGSNTVAKPGRIDFGVLDLWVESGKRRSEGFRPAFDLKKAGIEPPPPPDPAPDPAFNILPGKDEAAVRIKWQVYGKSKIHSAKLELFANGIAQPIWQRPIHAVPLKDDEKGLTSVGELQFGEIKPDPQVKRKDADGNDVLAFPKGVLTLASSPYQLKITVSAETAPGEPPGADRFAFPAVAWTYVHVLIKKLEVAAGPRTWLDDKRDDVDQEYRAKTLEREKAIVDVLARETLATGAVTPIKLISNVGFLEQTSQEFQLHEKLWGHGPRIPLTATPVLLDVNGAEHRDGIADVVAGADVIWDWTDDHPERWKETIDDKLEFDTRKTREFLELLHKKFAPKYDPKGSCNCPIDYGGKYGDPKAPIFPPQDGKGPFPFAVAPLPTRAWAARSSIDPATGKAGVIFQPSRMAGDRYDVAAYLYDKALDITEKLETAPGMKGDAGTFEVLRERTLHHIKLGHVANVDIDEMKNTAITRARKQLSLSLDFHSYPLDDAQYTRLLETVAADTWLSEDVCEGTYARPLIFKHAWDPSAPVGTSAMVLRSRKELRQRLAEDFRQCEVLRVKRREEVPMGSGTAGDQALKNQPWRAPDGTMVVMSEGLGPGGDFYVMAEKGKRVPLGQKLSATVQHSSRAGYTIKEIHYDQIGSDRSAYGVEFVWQEDGSKKKTIDIKFPNGDVHTIKYTKKAIGRRLRRNMTKSEKAKLKAAFEQGCANQNPQKSMSVKVIGRSDSQNAEGRKKRLLDVLKGFVETDYMIHDKYKAFEHFKTNSGFTLWMGEMKSQPSWRDLSYKNAITAIYKRLIDALRAANPAIQEGIIVTHVQRLTNLTDLPDDRRIHFKETSDDKNPNADKKDKSYYDMPLGAYENSYEANNPFLKVLRFGTPDPKSKKTAEAGAAKSAISVFLHELAHAYGVKHSPYPPGFTGPTADAQAPKQHLAGEGCIMDYHQRTDEFCGICRVRSRGWDWEKIPNQVDELKAEVKVSIGDTHGLFEAPASEELGLMQRLQVLGLFNRPIDYEPKEERDAAFALSKAHAKKVLDLEDLAEGIDAKIREFIVEKGALPKAGAFARLRLPAGWTPYYGVGDKMHEYPNHKAGDPPNRMDYWSLEAEKHRIEREILAANPALGAIPIHIDVKQVVGKSQPAPWRGARVFIQVLPPDKLAPAEEEKNGVKVLGATSFIKGYDVPNGGSDKAVAYRKNKIDGHQPSPDTDPQAPNVHHTLGGRRGLVQDNISTSVNGVRNLFTDVGWNDLPPNGYPDGTLNAPKARPNTVCVLADDNGCVDVVFWPSLIAGDRYKLKVYVESPDKENEIVGTPFTTGTMVRWRSVRLASYVQQTAPASADEVPDWIKGELRKKNKTVDECLGVMADIDLGTVSQHLARSYNELLVEEAALRPRAISAAEWSKTLEEWKKYVDAYPDLAGNTAIPGGNSKQSPLVDPLTADPARKVYTARLRCSTPVPGTVQVRIAGGGMETSAGHDWLAPDAEERPVESNIVAIAQGEAVCGNPEKKRTAAKVALVGSVNYGTGAVRIEFEQPQPPGTNWTIVYHALNFVDANALLPAPNEMPARSLFLLPMNGPEAYNAKKGAGTPAMVTTDRGDPPAQATYNNVGGWGTANALMGCLARAIEGNGKSFLPGIILVQSSFQDPYGLIWSLTQEGKGWGNVLFLYSPAKETDAEKFKKSVARLASHELGHCLYLQHADGNGGQKGRQPLEHDPAELDCMMTYSNAETKLHCGGCQANLRGIPMWDSPLNGTKHPHGERPVVTEPVDDESDNLVPVDQPVPVQPPPPQPPFDVEKYLKDVKDLYGEYRNQVAAESDYAFDPDEPGLDLGQHYVLTRVVTQDQAPCTVVLIPEPHEDSHAGIHNAAAALAKGILTAGDKLKVAVEEPSAGPNGSIIPDVAAHPVKRPEVIAGRQRLFEAEPHAQASIAYQLYVEQVEKRDPRGTRFPGEPDTSKHLKRGDDPVNLEMAKALDAQKAVGHVIVYPVGMYHLGTEHNPTTLIMRLEALGWAVKA